MHSISPSRFATFEILRSIIPGIYFTTILYALFLTFNIFPYGLYETTVLNTALFIVVSIIAGLSFYAKETPKKRKAFLSNQPSSYILERSREISSSKPLTEDEARRLYFFILNHHIPLTVHDKIFFFGMLYHIMSNIRRTSFWFGLIGIVGCIIHIVIFGRIDNTAAITIVLIWMVYGINVRYNKADRKMQENFHDQIFWLEMNSELVDTLILQRTNKQ